ncbi:MAG: hypothetical protein EBS19_10545 [Spirochaetia bacterium]|nr:hypothetical protein [Spirochaetia bacterium]
MPKSGKSRRENVKIKEMADVKRWSYGAMQVQFKKDGSSWQNLIWVDSAIMYDDVQCFHCGKNIKAGKLVFCGNTFFGGNPFERGDNNWGEYGKKTFCSSNHTKLFAKNNDGL